MLTTREYITKYSYGSKEDRSNEIVPKRCDSEQNYVHTTHHLYNQKCSHIFNLQRNENDFINAENENIMFRIMLGIDANAFDMGNCRLT